jgi:hypothetical protein
MGARKKVSRGRQGRTELGRRSGRSAGRQPVVPLPFDPFTPGQEHPEWVRTSFPAYVQHPHDYLARSVRTLENQGRTITITTTYEVRVEGQLVTLHMMVDEQGQLWSHLCPYQSFPSAMDLVRHLLRRMPHLFEAPPHDHDAHPAHGHGGA